MLLTLTANTLSHPFSSGKSVNGPPHVIPELLTRMWSLLSRFLNSLMRASHPALDLNERTLSRRGCSCGRELELYPDVRDDVMHRARPHLVDLIRGLSKSTISMYEKRKKKKEQKTHLLQLSLFPCGNVHLGPILRETRRYHLSYTRASPSHQRC